MPVRDFAEAEGLGRDTTYRLIAEGRIRAVRVNRRILIPRSELAAFPEREVGGDRND
jgi:excisionase family DNA binding protein